MCVAATVGSGSVASVQTGRGAAWVQERNKCVPRTARSWAHNIKKDRL